VSAIPANLKIAAIANSPAKISLASRIAAVFPIYPSFGCTILPTRRPARRSFDTARKKIASQATVKKLRRADRVSPDAISSYLVRLDASQHWIDE